MERVVDFERSNKERAVGEVLGLTEQVFPHLSRDSVTGSFTESEVMGKYLTCGVRLMQTSSATVIFHDAQSQSGPLAMDATVSYKALRKSLTDQIVLKDW